MADDRPSDELSSREPSVKDVREISATDTIVHQVDGVAIPFASPRLLWRMKIVTHREKDAPDLVFLRHWFHQHGEDPPLP